MPNSTIDLTRRLDDIERQLPALPAKSLAFGRATVRRGNDAVTSVMSHVARRFGRVAGVARTGSATTAGQVRSAAERTSKVARDTAKESAGQARAQAKRTAGAANEAAEALVDDATRAVAPDSTRPGVAYEQWTKADLYGRAQELDIDGRSSMSKAELISALRSS